MGVISDSGNSWLCTIVGAFFSAWGVASVLFAIFVRVNDYAESQINFGEAGVLKWEVFFWDWRVVAAAVAVAVALCVDYPGGASLGAGYCFHCGYGLRVIKSFCRHYLPEVVCQKWLFNRSVSLHYFAEAFGIEVVELGVFFDRELLDVDR